MDTGSFAQYHLHDAQRVYRQDQQVTFEWGAIPLERRGDIERIERETRIGKAMSELSFPH
jgi:hypothetical protein